MKKYVVTNNLSVLYDTREAAEAAFEAEVASDKERDMFVTDNYDIPTFFITKFLEENDCIIEEDGKSFVCFKEVVFKSNY